MSCPFEEDVSAWYDRELSDADAARVAAHIAQCAQCTALVAEFDTVRRSMRALRDVRVSSMAAPFWRRRIAIPLPIAAALAILFITAPFIAFHRGERARPAAPPAIVRQPDSGLLARYDGGGRAVITVRPKERAR